MRSEYVPRDYAALWKRVVAARFSAAEQQSVLSLLAGYVGPEPDRIKLGVLKAADCDLEKMSSFLRLAGEDWRDLLCAAEYPLTSHKWGLREKAPEQYDRLLAKEQAEYESWLQRALSAAKGDST